MSALHTRGPWIARPVPENDCEWEVIKDDPSQTWNEPHDRCWYIATVMDDADGGNAEANATLMAAAPEMRDALRELYALVCGECPSLLNEDSGGNSVLALQIEAAIAKASPSSVGGA